MATDRAIGSMCIMYTDYNDLNIQNVLQDPLYKYLLSLINTINPNKSLTDRPFNYMLLSGPTTLATLNEYEIPKIFDGYMGALYIYICYQTYSNFHNQFIMEGKPIYTSTGELKTRGDFPYFYIERKNNG